MVTKAKLAKMIDLGGIPEWIYKVLYNLIVFLGIYFAPMYAQGAAILVFLLIDMGTGIWASRKENRKITSNKLRKSVSKFITYGIALCTSVIFTKQFGLNILVPVAFGLATIEVKSIFENLYRISNINILKFVLDKLQNRNGIDEIPDNDPDSEKQP